MAVRSYATMAKRMAALIYRGSREIVPKANYFDESHKRHYGSNELPSLPDDPDFAARWKPFDDEMAERQKVLHAELRKKLDG